MTAMPSETKLRKVERELKKLRRGARRAVGGGVYMRLDSTGRRRFQLRVRQSNGNVSQPGRTYDTWLEAALSREEREEDAKLARGENRGEARETQFAVYASTRYWPSVVRELDAATRVQYERVLRQDVVPFWGDDRRARLGADRLGALDWGRLLVRATIQEREAQPQRRAVAHLPEF